MIALLAKGLPPGVAARYVGLPASCYASWMDQGTALLEEHTDLQGEVNTAGLLPIELNCLTFFEEANRATSQASERDLDNLGAASNNGNIKAAMWRLERGANREDFRPPTTHVKSEAKVDKTETIDLRKVVRDESVLDALMAAAKEQK